MKINEKAEILRRKIKIDVSAIHCESFYIFFCGLIYEHWIA